jgi:hypothetical protein
MTNPIPATPMARAHPYRGPAPRPIQPHSAPGAHAAAAPPSCPLPRRTPAGPGRSAPTWEELLGQR